MLSKDKNFDIICDLISGKRPVKTPYWLFINFPFIKSITGVTSKEYFGDAKTMMDSQIETYRKLEIDAQVSPDFGTITETNAFGAEIVFDNSGIPSTLPLVNVDIELLSQMKPVEPLSSDSMMKQLEFLEYMVRYAPPDVSVSSSNMMAPLTVAASLRGISDFCMDVLDDPEAANYFIETVTTSEIFFLREQKKVLGHMNRVLLSDDISSFFSSKEFESLVVPSYSRIFSEFPEAQKWLHNDGEALHLAKAISETVIQLWHVGSCVDLSEVFHQTSNNPELAICGGLNPLSDLLYGKETEIYNNTIELLKRHSETGRFIFSAGGFIGYGTPVKSIMAMINAVEMYNSMNRVHAIGDKKIGN